MNKTVKLVMFGFLIWLIPFLVSILIFPLKVSMNTLFESIMPVAITLTTVIFSYLYFNTLTENYVKEGVIAGVTWMIISLVIDLLLFLPPSPMQMSLNNYLMDIGLTYLIIPIITVGIGYQSKRISD